jgi:hypothetical protein
MYTYLDVQQMIEAIISEIPEETLSTLNGGIILCEESKVNTTRNGDQFILSEYINQVHGLGQLITIYYGSLNKVYGNASEVMLRHELKNILYKELEKHFITIAEGRDIDAWDRLKFWQ